MGSPDGMQPSWNNTMFMKQVSVRVLGARNVLARDTTKMFGGGGTSDVYCTIKHHKRHTVVSPTIEQTVTPSWPELPWIDMGVVDPAGFKALMVKLWDKVRVQLIGQARNNM